MYITGSSDNGNLRCTYGVKSYRIAGEKAVADFTLSLEFETGAGTGATDVSREDERLIEALRAGNPQAYEKLIDTYQQPVYNLIYRLMDDPSETPDVVQEVFLKVFRNIGSLPGQQQSENLDLSNFF